MDPLTPETLASRFPGLASSLDGDDGEALVAALELHDAQAGEALVAEGTTSSELFLVWDGQLDIVMGGRRLASLSPGALSGEVSLLDPGPAGAGVVTEQGCTVLRLSRARLDQLGSTNPVAAATLVGEVLRSLSARARAVGAGIAEEVSAGAA